MDVGQLGLLNLYNSATDALRPVHVRQEEYLFLGQLRPERKP